jgi:hypothetical protein
LKILPDRQAGGSNLTPSPTPATIATPEMAEIFDFFAISRMLEKHWHPPAGGLPVFRHIETIATFLLFPCPSDNYLILT